MERNGQRSNQKHDREKDIYIFTVYMENGHHFYTCKKQIIIC
jgi:hypothetical protein